MKTLVRTRKYDGTIRREWNCEFIGRESELLRFVGAFSDDILHSELGLIKKGTISYEYYWLDRWYNVFRFHEPDGTFRNYYCNIIMPPTFDNGVLDYVDLDVDILVLPDWSIAVLDQDEFNENSSRYGYPEELRSKVGETIEDLKDLISQRHFPFEKLPSR